MIDKEEVSKVSEMKNLSLKNAERDYLQEVILFNLYRKIRSEIVFKGGTALYKVYGLNRFSEDLDFTLLKKNFKLEELILKVIYQVFLLGIQGKVKESKKFRNEINIKLEFRGPLYNGNKESLVIIPLNISLREKISEAKNEFIISHYREIPSYEVYVLGEKEMVAEKIRAILTREKQEMYMIYGFWLRKELR